METLDTRLNRIQKEYYPRRFQKDLMTLTDEMVENTTRISETFGFVGNNHYESRTVRDNTIKQTLSLFQRSSDFELKLTELAIIFTVHNKKFYQDLLDAGCSNLVIATAFGTTVENLEMKQMYDRAVARKEAKKAENKQKKKTK